MDQKKVQGITKHEVVIQVNLIKPTDYTTIHVKAMITHVTSYNVLVGGRGGGGGGGVF